MRPIAMIMTVILAGCAGLQTTEKFEANLNGWVGRPIADYLATGVAKPSEVVDEPDGKRYTFDDAAPDSHAPPSMESSTVYRAGNGSGSSSALGASSPAARFHCTWSFHTDASGVITRYSWKGNDCRA